MRTVIIIAILTLFSSLSYGQIMNEQLEAGPSDGNNYFLISNNTSPHYRDFVQMDILAGTGISFYNFAYNVDTTYLDGRYLTDFTEVDPFLYNYDLNPSQTPSASMHDYVMTYDSTSNDILLKEASAGFEGFVFEGDFGGSGFRYNMTSNDTLLLTEGDAMEFVQNNPVSGNGAGIAINHANTSTLTASSNLVPIGHFINGAQVDNYGHFTSISTADLCSNIEESQCTFLTGKTVTIQGDLDGTSGSGSFDVPGSVNQTIEIAHGNTSNLNGQYGGSTSGWHINSIDLDHMGHVQGVVVTGESTTGHGTLGESDERLKKDIKPIDSPLDKVMKIDGVYYKWRDSTRNIVSMENTMVYGSLENLDDQIKSAEKNAKKTIREDHMGVIAQNIEEVFPEAVVTDAETGIKSVEYGKLVAPLIEAIKEQQKQINKLNQEIEELKSDK